MTCQAEQAVEYRCPGQAYAISRAVHLGRMARFYPGCRQCPHRDDTGTLSPKQVARLVETRPRGLPQPLFQEEGVAGVYLNELRPEVVREMAIALGVSLKRSSASGAGTPTVVIAGDGRPMTSELVAAVGEGLRWTGCDVVDIGPASSACLALAIDHLQAAGGMLVGNPGDRPQVVGLRFWAPGPRPLSAGRSLDPLRRLYQAGTSRPTRDYGSLRRFQADGPYLAAMAEHYHALRPLRFVFESPCSPIERYLRKLTENVACRIIRPKKGSELFFRDGPEGAACKSDPTPFSVRLSERVLADRAHFGVRIDDDGETCRVVDEQGRPVPPQRLLLIVARHFLAGSKKGSGLICRDGPEGAAHKLDPTPFSVSVVLEEGSSPALADAIRSAGIRVVHSSPRRAEMEQTLREQAAPLGGGPSGRFWYALRSPPLPDALLTLTLLLVVLSRSDRPLSEVLDREAPLR